MFKKSLKWSLSGVAAFGLMFAGLAPASAEEAPLDSTQVDELTSQFDLLGIDASTQEELIRAVMAGERLESWTDTSPVASETWIEEGVEHTLAKYSDGSRALTTVELPQLIGSEDPISPMATSVCSIKAGSVAFSGCRIERVTGGLVMSYSINGNLRNAANPTARITFISPVACSMAASVVTGTNSYIGLGSSTNTAWAEGTCSISNPIGNYTYGVRVNVNTSLSASEF